MNDVARAYHLGEGDIFTIGEMTYRFANGYLVHQVENGYDEFGFPTYQDSGKVYSTEEAQKIFEQEMENEKMYKEPKLTEYQGAIMEKQVKEHTFYNNGKTTVAILTMKNGFDVVGQSACVHRKDFDLGLGRHYALVDALRQVDAFIGFGRQQESYEQKQYFREQEEIERTHERMIKGEADEAPADEATEEVKKPAFVTGGLVNGELLHTIFNEPVLANAKTSEVLFSGRSLTGEGLDFLKAKDVVELDNSGNAVENADGFASPLEFFKENISKASFSPEEKKYNLNMVLDNLTSKEVEIIANKLLKMAKEEQGKTKSKFQGFVD